jgi:GalNAc-alpha-(1->4)-GalNAc-alpha-(1->3)-diNAcBac-PP-undecaprenol alpha-1,4-N-acetyl-D-galactosaminyltransferase
VPVTRADRITIVVASLGGGGAERVIVDLSRYLQDSGRQVTLLTLNGDDPDAYPLPGGVRRERMEIRRDARSLFESVSFLLGHLVAMRKKIVATAPDAVVSFIDQTNVRTLCCLLGTKIPVIVSERIHPEHHVLPQAWRRARQLIYPFADAVLAQTGDIANWFSQNTRARRLVVIPNAARSERDIEAGTNDGIAPRPLILAMGRLARQKGFDLLLEAFSRSRLKAEGWHLALLGEGGERQSLLAQAAALGLADALTLPGHVGRIGGWLAQADIFALSSRYEGFPNALLEAMQTGRACVSFDCPSGPRDLIENERNGLLVAAEDVDGFSAALRRLAGDSELRRRLGAEASQIAREFSPARVYAKWLALIDAVATGNAAAMFSPAARTPSSAG